MRRPQTPSTLDLTASTCSRGTFTLVLPYRRLWQHVTKSLKDGNIDEATAHKHKLEERQRGDEKQRAADNKPWTPKYFTKEVG